MNRLIKNLMVTMLAVIMFFSMALTPVQAKPGRGSKPTPPPTTQEPAEPTEESETEEEVEAEEAPAEEVTEEAPEEEAVAEEAPAEEATAEEAPVEEVSVEEALVEETPIEEVSAEEVPAEGLAVNSADAGAPVRLLAEEPPVRAVGSVPAHEKILTDNHDGTYTLALNVTGEAEKQTPKVNVIVIVDRSNSMDTQSGTGAYVPSNQNGNNMYGLVDNEYVPLTRVDNGYWANPRYTYYYNGVQYTGQRYQYDATATRLQATKAAVIGLGGSLLSYNEADGNPDDTVQMALVTFGSTAQTNVANTTDSTTFTNAVNGIATPGGYAGGTNWEAALQQANTINFGDNDPTFVIFFSDGSPTFRNTQAGFNDRDNNAPAGVWGSGQEEEPNMERAYDQATDDAATLANKYGVSNFYTIFAYGTTVGAGYMTDLTAAAGAPDSNNYSASSTAELNDAFDAILENIEMAGFGDVEIDDGTTNQVTTSSGTVKLLEVNESSYRYWRAGGEYGTGNDGLGEEWTDGAPEAKLVNGEVQWDLSSLGVLENGVTYTVTFEVYPSQQTYDYIAQLKNGDIQYSDLPAEVRQYLLEVTPGVSYTVLTNTVAKLHWDDTRDEAGRQEETYDNPPPVKTDSEKLTINKKWVGDDAPTVELPITVLMDGEEFHTAKLSSSGGWKTEASISIGIIKDGQALTGALGHDFSFAELDSTQYRWELDAPTVRPMLVDGDVTMLVKVDAKHPAPEGADTYSIEGSTYYVDEAATGLTATNYRRSHLDVLKAVENAGPEDPNSDNAKFDFTIKVVNSLAEKTGDEENLDSDYYVWFSVADSNNGYALVIEDDLVSGNVTRAKNANDEYTGYYYMPSGTEIHVNMKDGYSIRFLNLPSESTYEITESTTMPSGDYSFNNITVDTNEEDGTVTTYTEPTVEGTILLANHPHTVTVKNRYNPSFYVYHSSDNTIEKIKMDDSRVTVDDVNKTCKFNIVEETKSGYLYGGYFSAYSDAGMTDAAIIGADYTLTDAKNYTYNKAADPERVAWTKDTAGTAYTGDKVNVWKAKNVYTAAGNAMSPAPGTVYYLKEVPEAYFTPGLYYIYDTRDPEKHIKKLYLMIPMDDGIYTSYGSVNNSPAATTNKMYASYKVTKYDGTTETKKAQDVNTNITRGYLAVWDVKDLISKGGSYDWTPSYVTKDNITVTSIQRREIVIGNGCFDAATSRKYTADEDTSGVQAFYVVDHEEDSTYSAN